MKQRIATCGCGQVQAHCQGDPVRVSVCHCLECQRRTGSVLSAQARWPDDQIEILGTTRDWVRVSDTGKSATFRFCPECGSTIAYRIDALPGLTAIPTGAFADPEFPDPDYSVYEQRKHRWLTVEGQAIEHFD